MILVAKAGLRETNTAWAQGGIAAVLGLDDSLRSHIDDTIQVGQGLCENKVVEKVIGDGPRALAALQSFGAEFDRNPDGTLDLQREGGHSHARVVHARGDLTGREIERAMVEQALRTPTIQPFENTFAIDLLKDANGACMGVLAWKQDLGFVAFAARRTVLATGGAGWLYRETTNPPISTADGIAMAFRAGAALRDLEFIQFHPTTLYVAGAGRLLVSEIVRGKGGILVDRHGRRFMEEYHSDLELAPRDVVSRAIVRQMEKTRDTSAYLDLRNIKGDVLQLFPHMAEVCKFFDIDISRDRIPVRPAAHYCVGGVEVNENGETTIANLYAVGEVASSGLHGANRIGSNSLLEGIVFGTRIGRSAASAGRGGVVLPRFYYERKVRPDSGSIRLDIEDVAYTIRSLMTRSVGVERSDDGLGDAAGRLDGLARYMFAFELGHARAFEVANLVMVARLVAEAARYRCESRGTHYRTDYAARNDTKWRLHTRLVARAGGVRIESSPLSCAVGSDAG